MASRESDPSRASIIARRWASVLTLSALGIPIALLLAGWQGKLIDQIVRLPSWMGIAAAAVVVIPVILRPWRATARLGLRHALAYPPYWIWMGAGVATSMLLVRVRAFDHTFSLDGQDEVIMDRWIVALYAATGLVVLTSVSAALSGGGVRRWRKRSAAKRGATSASQPRPALDVTSLRKWIATDDPVSSLEEDLFGHVPIAERISKRLVTTTPSAQAVVGQLGSGKSTVRRFVETFVAAENRARTPTIHIIPVELWPYETPRAAVEGVVARLVESLSAHVSVLRLSGLPTRYGDAIEKAGGGVALAIWRLQEQPGSPLEILRIADDIAVAIGVRYVLWVEDLERFAVGDPQRDVASGDEAEKLAPIRALLYGLDQFRSVSVVTATTDLFRRFDLEKVARHVERLPPIAHAQLYSVFAAFRKEWLGTDDIDPG